MATNFSDYSSRKKQGVEDLTLVTKVDNPTICETLKKRYMSDLIYTYIGNVLISVNPYKKLPIYTNEHIQMYKGHYRVELPPHVFALAEEAYRSMTNEYQSQCIIISGESGAGKTEASKLIMQYIAAVSGNGQGVERIKRIILESNPLLEAFGNAKTVRNNNSSRFGKYFEIQFDARGDPEGGKITNYLLEKSRVVYQQKNERNFHIFYQLCTGADQDLRRKLKLGNPDQFYYLNQSGCMTVEGVDDVDEFNATRNAMSVIGITEQEQLSIFKLLAGILHLGNVQFANEGDGAKITGGNALNDAAQLLGVDPMALSMALMFRVISTMAGKKVDTYNVPQNKDQAGAIRDALAKAIYDRVFDWLVAKINAAMQKTQDKKLVIGVLDIYGFEVFSKNGFEQFCINYVNEKLQQIFIELTLKAEQEEYVKEGIKWEEIKYFNNKIVCDLIEGKRPPGIFSILDDTCSTVHAVDSAKADEKFAAKVAENIRSHPHFIPAGGCFTVKHYAGDVCYDTEGFTDKNKDSLYNTLIEAMKNSSDNFIRNLFPERLDQDDKKKPTTSGFKIKNSSLALVSALMECTPHYIRCIKPNETKKPRDIDNDRLLHQIKYLGLLENVRVRRAGFAYRGEYDRFLNRFCILSNKVWPNYRGDAKKGCEELLLSLKIETDQWQLGKTKIFLRHPETLFSLEEARERKYHDCAARIQRLFRKYKMRKYFLDLRQRAADLLQGKKQRRRHSINRLFAGDYLRYTANAQLQDLVSKNQGGPVIFADMVEIPKAKMFEFIMGFRIVKSHLIVTANTLFLIDRVMINKKQAEMQVTKMIKISDIAAVSMSTLQDSWLVVHNGPGNKEDIFMDNQNKVELMTVLSDAYKNITNRDLPLNFVSQMSYRFNDKGKIRQVVFTEDSTGNAKVPVLALSGGKYTVTVVPGLPASSRPSVIQYVPKKSDNKPKNNVNNGRNNGYANTNNSQQAYPKQPAVQQLVQEQQAGQRGSLGFEVTMPRVSKSEKTKSGPPPPPRKDPRPRLRVMYAYSSQADDELNLVEGDIIALIRKDESGWWEGELAGKVGLFPGNYVEQL